MLNAFWNWFVIIVTIANILGCWWLLHWTSKNKGDTKGSTTGHRWDGDLEELNNPLPRWWLMLFHITIVFGLIYLVLYPGLGNVKGVLGWTQLNRYQEQVEVGEAAQRQVFARFDNMSAEDLIADEEARDIGHRLFAHNCAMCHGSDGRGAPGFPNLADDDWLYGNDYDDILTSISSGRQGVMPPLGGALGDDGLWETVAYVQSLSGQKADSGLVSRGAQRYATLCVACHGVDGTGNQLLGAPNLTDDIWLYGGQPQQIADSIVQGRNGNMPAHDELLNEERRRILAAYVAGLNQSE